MNASGGHQVRITHHCQQPALGNKSARYMISGQDVSISYYI